MSTWESTDAGADPFGTVCAFVDAIVWGEHHVIWELFGPDAREHALAAAGRKGMDAVAVARARQGTWGVEEADNFLSALVRGLRVDLSGTDLDTIHAVDAAEVRSNGSVRYRLECATLLPPEITGGADWAAGAVVVHEVDGRWRVRLLEPRPPAGP